MPDRTDKKNNSIFISYDTGDDEQLAIRINELHTPIAAASGAVGHSYSRSSLIKHIFISRYHEDFLHSLHYNLEDEKGNIGTISKTVWTLWKDQPERIWSLLHRWSRGYGDINRAGNNILKHGIDNGYVTPDDAFDRLWEWLLSDEEEMQEAAGSLLPAIPAYYLFGTAGRWVELLKDERRTKLSDMLIRLFIMDMKQTLEIFVSWTEKHPGAFDGVIGKTLESFPVLNGQAPEYYRSMDIQLRLFKEKFDKQSPVWLAADQLCRDARKLRSKAINWQKDTGQGAQFSKNDDPHLSSKSIRKRKT